jgi:hypothetical protein
MNVNKLINVVNYYDVGYVTIVVVLLDCYSSGYKHELLIKLIGAKI